MRSGCIFPFSGKLEELNSQIQAFEAENNRLQNELQRLQDRNTDRMEADRDRRDRDSQGEGDRRDGDSQGGGI